MPNEYKSTKANSHTSLSADKNCLLNEEKVESIVFVNENTGGVRFKELTIRFTYLHLKNNL